MGAVFSVSCDSQQRQSQKVGSILVFDFVLGLESSAVNSKPLELPRSKQSKSN